MLLRWGRTGRSRELQAYLRLHSALGLKKFISGSLKGSEEQQGSTGAPS